MENEQKFCYDNYVAPPIHLLSDYPNTNCEQNEGNVEQLQKILDEYGLSANVVGCTQGPAIVRYEVTVPFCDDVNTIFNCEVDIEYELKANGKVRFLPCPRDKRKLYIEVPRNNREVVTLKEIVESEEFAQSSSFTFALGKDFEGKIMTSNLGMLRNILVSGTTGSGKSILIDSIILSLIYKNSPKDVRFILIDPKQVELTIYRKLPHLLTDVISDTDKAINSFTWAIEELERRNALMCKNQVRNINDYNQREEVKAGLEPKLSRIVIIVDELSDLMLTERRKELEQKITYLAQRASFAGIHLVLATQRPACDVLTSEIRANLPSRIAFRVTSVPDSKTILGERGAETLLGRGDMLYAPMHVCDPIRVQGAYVSIDEIEKVVEYLRDNYGTNFDQNLEQFVTQVSKKPMTKIENIIDILRRNDLKISIAESFTGGGVASAFVSVPGASDVFSHSLVCYDWRAKEEFLGVSEQILVRYGAVSAQTVSKMLDGLAQSKLTDVVVATSGNAGPTAEKIDEVGLFFVGVMVRGKKYIKKYLVDGTRKEVILLGVKKCLNLILEALESEKIF